MWEKIKTTITEAARFRDSAIVKLMPAHLAFFTLLSLLPIVIVVFFVAVRFSIPIQEILASVTSIVPDPVSDILSPGENTASGQSIGIWLIVAMFTGSIGIHSVIIGSDALYGFKADIYPRRRLKAFFLTVLLLTLVLIGFAIIGFGWYLLDLLSDMLSGMLPNLISLAQWLLIGLLCFAAVKFVYTAAPHKRIPNNCTTLGTLFTIFGWLLATLIYTFYYTNFGHYSDLYGGLANIIVTMIWLYILAIIFVEGLLINVWKYQQLHPVEHQEHEGASK